MKRNIYLDLKSLEEARRIFLSAFDWLELVGSETIAAAQALGRITTQPVFAAYSSPPYHGAAMDGIAVLSSDTFGADDDNPAYLKLGEKAHMVNTGNPLPEGTDSVVMIEHIHQTESGEAELRSAAFPWQHVRRVGEDIVAGEMLLPHHHRLTAPDLSALLGAGVFEVEVLKKPKVAIIPTGSELMDWRQARANPPGRGDIIETNSVMLAGLVSEAGAEPVVWEKMPDRLEDITRAMEDALESDAHMVILNAGASAGSKDFTSHALGGLGRVLVHGVTVMPGKPSILGLAKDKPVVGSPGYPVSAWVCFDQFIAPALARMQGRQGPTRKAVSALPARRLPSKLGQEEFIRVHLGRVGEHVVATPLKRGAGAISSLTKADGIVRIPAESDGVEETNMVTAELLGPTSSLARHLVVVGSHDITLDLLADHIKRLDSRIRVSSSHVGSLAGLMAIAGGKCHLGGTHLLDPQTGEYNISYLKRHLKGVPARLVTLANRQQGFIVKPGNPKGISDFNDLLRDDVTLVNRQAGSGTRVLMDYHLEKLGLDPAGIKGYEHDEYTHMAVAVHVAAGGADVGLGILAAAEALGLDFAPVMMERYDLCIPTAHLEDPRVKLLLRILEDKEFKRQVEGLGGYDVEPMGRVAWEG